jgi:alkylhydroperoxidase family enzyme
MRAHAASSKRIGLTDEHIRALAFYQRSPLFDEKDKAVILYAERVTRGASAIRDGAHSELSRFLDEGQIVELTLVICTANFTNRFNDALRAIPDIGV